MFAQVLDIMKEKYFHLKGEIAFRMWMFANAVEALKETPNKEKAKNLRAKMIRFTSVIADSGTFENIKDIETLIAAL